MPTWLLVALLILVVTTVFSLGFARAAARGDEQLEMLPPERDAPHSEKRFERSHQHRAHG